MKLDRQIKIGLDETRLLILGVNILLGFQFRGVFEEGFKELPAAARALDAVALLLMVVSIALLVTPSVHHRIVEEGRSSERLRYLISIFAGIALLPFALGLGLGVYIALRPLTSAMVAALAGVGFLTLALWFWFGIEIVRRGFIRRKRNMADQQLHDTPLATRIEQMLTEARVMLPGAQALLGFQLLIALTKTFAEVPAASKLVHALSLGCITLAIVLLMAPAAYHRLVYHGEDSEDMHRTGSRLVTAASVPLALGITGDVYVTIEHIAGSTATGVAAAAASLAVLVGLWHVYPLMVRYRRRVR